MSISKGEAFWAEHIQKMTEQGLSYRDYAAANGLRQGTLRHWRGLLSPRKSNEQNPGMSFVPVKVDQAPRSPEQVACTLILSHSLQVQLESLPSPAWLADLFLKLRGAL